MHRLAQAVVLGESDGRPVGEPGGFSEHGAGRLAQPFAGPGAVTGSLAGALAVTRGVTPTHPYLSR